MCNHCGCRSYPPIAELTAEHVVILELAGRLADATDHHRPVDEAAREELVELLIRHVAKEEAGLYPLLIAELEERPGAFDHLEAEHREVLDAIAADTFDHLALYALQRHIEEEDEALFSGARFNFESETWDVLEAVHREVDHGIAVAP